MATPFKIVIPARYASARLPGKPLLELAGRPMLHHVCDCAQRCGAEEVIVATDDERIARAVRDIGVTVCMTDAAHTSGTERLSEVVEQSGWDDDTLVVNLQGDEPLMPASLVRQVAADLASNPDAAMATLAYLVTALEEINDPNVVKVVRDRAGNALYFSRAPIPFDRTAGTAAERRDGVLRHIGLYAYRASFLKQFKQLEPSPHEQAEKLEQLRALWHGFRIQVGIAAEMPGPGIDTADDLARVEEIIKTRSP